MEFIRPLRDFLKSKYPFLSDEDISMVMSFAEIREYPQGEQLLREGETRRILGFVLEGLVRVYFLRDGVDYTFDFREQFEIFGNLDSLLANVPTTRFIEVSTPCRVLMIDYDELQTLTTYNDRIETIRVHILQENLIQSIQRVEQYISLKPEERYLKLLAERPALPNQVPLKHIATYLGVTAVSLSRIRNRIKSD